jgi:hypothetical protein
MHLVDSGRLQRCSNLPYAITWRTVSLTLVRQYLSGGDLYAAAVAEGALDVRQTIQVNETGFAASTQTVITLDTRVATPNWAPGDVIHAVDDAVLGTIKTVDSDTQITLTKANVDAIADDDVLYNISPIQLILGGTI